MFPDKVVYFGGHRMTLEFLAVSPHNPFQKDFRDFLKQLEGVDVRVVSNLQNAKSQIFRSKPNVLFVHLSQITDRSMQGIEQIRRPLDLPVILFTNKVTEESLKLARKYKKYYVLGRPYLSRDVLGIAYKMVHEEVPEQQLCRRYVTNQQTELQIVGEMDNIPARITNLSLSGCKISYGNGYSWSEGDLLKLDVPLDKLQKQHSVHAKVVWVERDASNEMGVEFIPTEDVYSHLLANV